MPSGGNSAKREIAGWKPAFFKIRQNGITMMMYRTPRKRSSGNPGSESASRVWIIDYISGERPPSGIAGWHGGWIAGIGSEGTRDALLPASPVPERQVTVASARKTERPAISCTALFAIFVRGSIWCGVSLASLSGGARQSNSWENWKSFQSATLEYVCCGRKLGGPVSRSQ